MTQFQQGLIQDWIGEFNINCDDNQNFKFNKRSQYQKLKTICKNIRLVEIIKYFAAFKSKDFKYGSGYESRSDGDSNASKLQNLAEISQIINILVSNMITLVSKMRVQSAQVKFGTK